MTKRPAIGFDSTATIKRSDFDVAMYVPNVGDEVKLRITTEAMAPAADAAEYSRLSYRRRARNGAAVSLPSPVFPEAPRCRSCPPPPPPAPTKPAASTATPPPRSAPPPPHPGEA